jgi:hypothetical protein
MTDQVEAIADELVTEELDLVSGGLTCRKAGGTQDGATSDPGIIAI